MKILLMTCVLLFLSTPSLASSKKPRKNKGVRGPLYPFTLRLHYTPSYRFLSKKLQDDIAKAKNEGETMELAQFFPIAAGLEAEFAFNRRISLAVSGNFSWHDKLFIFKNVPQNALQMDSSYREFVGRSSLYFNIANYFKLGAGVGLSFITVKTHQDITEEGKKYEFKTETSTKEMSGHLALRRDFFWSQIGVGIGLNTSMPLTDMFDIKSESRLDGKLFTEEEEENNNNGKDKDDDDDRNLYSLILMPMLYLVF